MELFDLVNKKDEVIGITDKITAHANRQLHRVIAVYVFDAEGRLYVQVHKSSGGKWDHSVGGHVSKGESYNRAAQREAEEELGIKQPLEHLATFYSNEGAYLHMFALYECTANETWKFVPNDEVEEIIPMNLEDIISEMQQNPQKFTGGFRNTMKTYLELKSNEQK